MLKVILSIVGGLVLAFAIVFATDAVLHATSTAPRPSDNADAATMGAYVASLSTGTLAGLLAGWTLAAFAGAAVAAWFALRGLWPGIVVAVLFLLATVANFMLVPHPFWMVATGIALIVLGGLIGAHIGLRSALQTPAHSARSV